MIERSMILALAMTVLPALAQQDVDLADSLNFEAFHKDKRETTKLFEAEEPAPSAAALADEPPKGASDSAVEARPAQDGAAKPAHTGQRFEVRERYTLTRSASTPYSAFYVIEVLHRQMAATCPNGWHKLREFSKPVENDFYLHYLFECL
ncbi:MAG TPA: hypothetical protein VL027_09260 [Spongiibacteraceae bacterium]|jgi:hypothetical protein|nr:hypothetical protein [Spongiibacteraceae bacterium]HUH38115.1 hypothetical protein [Spongiibacteraceae bacterium]